MGHKRRQHPDEAFGVRCTIHRHPRVPERPLISVAIENIGKLGQLSPLFRISPLVLRGVGTSAWCLQFDPPHSPTQGVDNPEIRYSTNPWCRTLPRTGHRSAQCLSNSLDQPLRWTPQMILDAMPANMGFCLPPDPPIEFREQPISHHNRFCLHYYNPLAQDTSSIIAQTKNHNDFRASSQMGIWACSRSPFLVSNRLGEPLRKR